MRFPSKLFAASIVVAVATACGAQERQARGFAVTDSGGVAIAVNDAPVSTLNDVVIVGPSPRLRIGAVDGAEELQFNRVRFAVRLSGDGIAVANGSPPEIRIFDGTGAFVRKHGRRGQGPGEFQTINRLMRGPGDTLLAVSRRQLMRFAADSGHRFTTTASTASALRDGRMRLCEGASEYLRNASRILAVCPEGPPAEYPSGVLFRPAGSLVWLSADGTLLRQLGEVPQIQQMFVDIGGGRREAVIPPSARFPMLALNATGRAIA